MIENTTLYKEFKNLCDYNRWDVDSQLNEVRARYPDIDLYIAIDRYIEDFMAAFAAENGYLHILEQRR